MDQGNFMAQLLRPHLNQIRTQELTNMLSCYLCHNFYRFPHTLADCGHTFCQLCLINYMKTFKGRSPAIKCPKCHASVDGNFRKSIFKDVYMQQMIQMLIPEFVQTDKIIVDRLKILFPEFDFESLVDNFKYVQWSMTANTKKKEQKNQEQKNKQSVAYLPEKVRQRFGISFQQFQEKIKDENQFNKFLDQIKNPVKKQGITIQVKAKTQRDFSYIGINNQMKAGNLKVPKLQKFLQKKALNKISKTQNVPPEWMNKFDDRLDAKVYLFIGDHVLQAQDNIQQLLDKTSQNIIVYSLSL